MQEDIKEAISSALYKATEILRVQEEQDVLALSQLSDLTIENASIYQDEDSISVAVLIYATYKVIERPAKLPEKQYHELYQLLHDARIWLTRDNIQNYRKAVKRGLTIIEKIDRQLKLYIEEVVRRAKIKKGSKLHEHGLSLGRAAELLGINQWELMNYIGKTQIFDKEKFIDDVEGRLAFTRSLFS